MELWSDYEGKTLDGRFPLERLIGPSGRSAAFLTKDATGEPAVVRVVETLNYEEKEILARWRTVEGLGQENLLDMREMGQTEMGGAHLVYALLEPTDAELEDALGERPLTPEETKQIGTSLVKALMALHGAGLVHEHVEASYVLGAGDVVKLRSDCVREMPEGSEGVAARARDVRDLATLLFRALTLRKEAPEVGIGPALPAPFDVLVREGMEGIWGLEEIGSALEDRAPVVVTPPRPDAAWKVPAAGGVPRVYTTDAGSGRGEAAPRLTLRGEMPEDRVAGVDGLGVGKAASEAVDRGRTGPLEPFRDAVPRVFVTRAVPRESLPGEVGGSAQAGSGTGAEDWPGGEVRRVRREAAVLRSIGAVDSVGGSSAEVETERRTMSSGVGDLAAAGQQRAGAGGTDGGSGAPAEAGLGAFARRGEPGGGRPVAPDRIVVKPELADGGMRRRRLLTGAGVVTLALAAFGVHAWRGVPAAPAAGGQAVTAPASGTADRTSASAAVPQPADGQGAAVRHRRSEVGNGVGTAAGKAAQGDWRVVAYTFRRESQAEHKAKQLAERHGGLRPQVFSPTGRAPYLVALGGWMPVEQAMAVREKARREGLPRDVYTRNYKRGRER